MVSNQCVSLTTVFLDYFKILKNEIQARNNQLKQIRGLNDEQKSFLKRVARIGD